jgi:cell wall-associated NlpC family hydrolase
MHYASATTSREYPVHRTTFFSAAAAVSSALLAPAHTTIAQQSDVSISPFVSFLPSAGTSPLAGLALTLAGNAGLGLRASGHLALENSNTSGFGSTTGYRPWGADADAMLLLGSPGGLMPFVFAGIGTSGGDSGGFNTMHSNWSYGAGATIPLGGAVDVFGEARWRMSRYVLPTATYAPRPTNELRVGLSFHVAGPSTSSGEARRPRDRRMDVISSSRPSVAYYPLQSSSSAAVAARVVGTADQYIGAPYRYGGVSPNSGFDCSGFVQYVFERHGVRLPRTAGQQAQVGQPLATDWRALSAGDLVMFAEDGRIDHVAIYAGRNRIIHSSASGGGVRYDDLSTQRGEWFADHMVAARRVTPDGRGIMLDLTRGLAEAGSLQLDLPDHAPKPR